MRSLIDISGSVRGGTAPILFLKQPDLPVIRIESQARCLRYFRFQPRKPVQPES